jgi:chromosomal replication initiation ATPase DnaA
MDLESVHDESVRLSVPTRFLKSWIQAHYADRVLTCWQAEMPEVHRIDLTVRTAIRCDGAGQGSRPRRSKCAAVPSGPTAGRRPSCARPPSRRCPPATTRSAARRSIRA